MSKSNLNLPTQLSGDDLAETLENRQNGRLPGPRAVAQRRASHVSPTTTERFGSVRCSAGSNFQTSSDVRVRRKIGVKSAGQAAGAVAASEFLEPLVEPFWNYGLNLDGVDEFLWR